MRSKYVTLLLLNLLLATMFAICSGKIKSGLVMNFYRKSCPKVDFVVRQITWNRVATDSTLIGKLVRLHYHDCFVRGCDASLLLDKTPGGEPVEKASRANQGTAGYEVIDEIKAELERRCPETVSCADILALAAREAVAFQVKQPKWRVALGRRDGTVSLATEAARDLPLGSSNFTTLYRQIQDLGLSLTDLVALSGAHTVGHGHCFVISKRLFNFYGNGSGTDPSLDPNYANQLKKMCSPNPKMALEMDPQSSLAFDNHYYVTLTQNKGLFQSDAALLSDRRAAKIVRNFLKPNVFLKQFQLSMMHMGALNVLTGTEGEIRNNCHFVN